MSNELAVRLVDKIEDVIRSAKHGDEARRAPKHFLEARPLDLERAKELLALALGYPSRADVGEQHRNATLLGLADAEREEIEPAAHRLRPALKADRLARAGHQPVGLDPVGLDGRYQFPHRAPHGVDDTGLLHERRVGLEEAVVYRPVLRVELYFDDAEAHVDGVEQRVVLRFALAHHLLGSYPPGDVTPEDGGPPLVGGIRVDLEVQVIALTHIVVREVSLDSLRHHSPVLPLGFRTNRCRKRVPVCSAHELVARLAECALRRRVQREDPELAVHSEMLIGDLIENARGPVVGTCGLSGGALALRDDAMCRLLANHERATNASIVVADWAVAVGPPDVFEPTVALDGQILVFVPCGVAPRHHLIDLRTDCNPAVTPELAAACAEGPRVPATAPQDVPVVVVVELDELGPPPEEHRVSRGEHDANGCPQALRPARDGSERRGCPVEGTAQCAHLAASGKEHVCGCVRAAAHLEAGMVVGAVVDLSIRRLAPRDTRGTDLTGACRFTKSSDKQSARRIPGKKCLAAAAVNLQKTDASPADRLSSSSTMRSRRCRPW